MSESITTPQIQLTKDGSHTLFNAQLNECYHSSNGAKQESLHVFIEAGLKAFLANTSKKNIHILELGFGTGLNAILSYKECKNQNIACHYTGIEAYPLDAALTEQLNYSEWMDEDEKSVFMQMHQCKWNENLDLNHSFSLEKIKAKIEDMSSLPIGKLNNQFDLVYMDAFDPAKQPELWTEEVFKTIFQMMNNDSYILTYSSKGDVKRAMRAAGFKVERLPGPIGKRHMLRGKKY